MTVGINHYLILSGLLFVIGVYGIITRRNVLLILLAIELIVNAANLSFIAFSHYLGDLVGQVFVFFTMTVAACEVTVGLAVAILLYRTHQTLHIDEINLLKR